MIRPIYLLAPGGTDPGLDGLIPGWEPVRVEDAGALRDLPPGLLLLPVAKGGAEQVLEALAVAAQGPSDAGWLPVLVEAGPEGGPARLLPVSIGWASAPSELARWLGGAEDAQVLELRLVLNRVARGRHDVNNPLTSAMAETQLALMDVQEPAIRHGLETVEEQLRRIRDLIAGLRALRPPR
jgi:signal transduction histidine kinase